MRSTSLFYPFVGVLEEQNITVEAQKTLSAVTRVERQYRSGLGIAVTIRLLRGSKDQRVLQLGLDKLPTYGVMREKTRPDGVQRL